MCCGEELEEDSNNIKVLVLEAEGLNQVRSARSQQLDTCIGLR